MCSAHPVGAPEGSSPSSSPFIDIDPAVYLAFAQASTQISICEEFRSLVRDHVRTLFPHGMLLACVGRLAFDQIEAIKLLGVDVPPAYIEQLPKVSSTRERMALMRCVESRKPVVVRFGLNEELMSPRMRQEMLQFDIGTLAAHGVLDLSSNMGTYFSFWKVDPSLSVRQIEGALDLICPLLHTALIRVRDLPSCLPDLANQLTDIERQILAWLAAGRTNAEMARLRGRSPSTIRNQLERLYRKLGVGNRTEATQLALGRGLI